MHASISTRTRLVAGTWCLALVICAYAYSVLHKPRSLQTLQPAPDVGLVMTECLGCRGNCQVQQGNASREPLCLLQDAFDMINQEMADFEFNASFHDASKLTDWMPEFGGRSRQIVVISSFRSGSSFLGEIIRSHPATWYAFEPLMYMKTAEKIAGLANATTALGTIKQLLKCNYTNMEQYLLFGKYYFFHGCRLNMRLWKVLNTRRDLCYQQDFLPSICRHFPINAMKVVRLRLAMAEPLLQDPGMTTQLVYLVRDPRATMKSRKKMDWCTEKMNCNDPEITCQDLTADFEASQKLRQKYPGRIRVLRFEDLAMHPESVVSDLMRFLKLSYHQMVQRFVTTHTQHGKGGPYSTMRNSTASAFAWQKDLDFQAVRNIQQACVRAMQVWGYLPASNATNLKTFNPIAEFKYFI